MDHVCYFVFSYVRLSLLCFKLPFMGGVCDVIVLIIISAHAPARERALFKVEHVVSTVTVYVNSY